MDVAIYRDNLDRPEMVGFMRFYSYGTLLARFKSIGKSWRQDTTAWEVNGGQNFPILLNLTSTSTWRFIKSSDELALRLGSPGVSWDIWRRSSEWFMNRQVWQTIGEAPIMPYEERAARARTC